MTSSSRIRRNLVTATFGSSLFLVLWSATLSAHITVTAPPERAGTTGKGRSCGKGTAGKAFEAPAGSELTVNWKDTVAHPGWYLISFDPTGDDFDGDGDGTGDYPGQSQGKGMTAKNGSGQLVLKDKIDLLPFGANRTLGDHTATVTLPNTPCDKCTLQVIQVMDDAAHAPSSDTADGHIYFHCADMKLTGGAAPTASGSPPAASGSGMTAPPPLASATSSAATAKPATSATSALVAPSATATPTSPPTPVASTAPTPTATLTAAPTTAPAVTPTATTAATAAVSPTATPAASTTSAAATSADNADDGGCSVGSRTAGHGSFALALLALLGAVGIARRRS